MIWFLEDLSRGLDFACSAIDLFEQLNIALLNKAAHQVAVSYVPIHNIKIQSKYQSENGTTSQIFCFLVFSFIKIDFKQFLLDTIILVSYETIW